MPAGEIRRRVNRENATPAKPSLDLPWQIRGAEPVFRIMIDMAAEARDVQLDVRDVIEQLLEETKKQNDLLRLIADNTESSAGTDVARSAESAGDAVEAAPVSPAVKPAEDPDG